MGASPAPDTGVLRKDLEVVVDMLLRAFGGSLRQALPGLVADMAHDPELAEAIRKKALAVRRRSMRGAFARAAARGEVLGKLDIELILDSHAGFSIDDREKHGTAASEPFASRWS